MRLIARIVLFFALCAFIGTTSASAMPSVSHALEHGIKIGQSQAPGHKCHHHAETKLTDKEAKKAPSHCCEKGMCKCTTGSCNGGFAKLFGNSGLLLAAFALSSDQISFADEYADSALPEGLKRPPKA